MLPSAPGRMTGLRALGVALLAVVLSVTLVPGAAAAAPSGASTREEPPAGSPGVDFPVLPERCYDPYHPAPTLRCPIVEAGRDRPTIVLWGDSHAWQYLPAAVREAEARRLNLVLFVAGGCPPTLRPARVVKPLPACVQANRTAFDYVSGLRERGRDVRVLLGSFWAFYRIGYQELQQGVEHPDYYRDLFRLQHRFTAPLFEALGRARVPFDIIGQSATVPDDARDCAAGNLPYQCELPRRQAMPQERATRKWLREMTRSVPGRQAYLDVSASSCTATTCRPRVRGTNVYYDVYHFGATFAATLGRFLERPFDQLAARSD